MIATRKGWTWAPAKPSTAPQQIKADVSARARDLIDSQLKRTHIEPPPKSHKFNYLVDISAKWHGRFFYFVSKYACPGPNAMSPFFESGFARLEYHSSGTFHLAYMRHTGRWWQLYADLSIQEAMNIIVEDQLFQP